MADVSKADKLAAARKKLKEFQNQQKNKENSERATEAAQALVEPATVLNGISGTAREDTKTVEESPHQHVDLNQEVPVVTSGNAIVPEPRTILSNYFAYPNNNYFFDIMQKNEEAVRDSNEFSIAEKEKSAFSIHESSHLTNLTKTDSSNTISEEESSSFASSRIKFYEEEVQNLKQELEQAFLKIKMQADALEYVTSDREELSTKFSRAIAEVNSYKEQMDILQNQLRENERFRVQLQETVNELAAYREKSSAHELELKQYINDLKDENADLQQNIEIQKDKNSNLQKRFEEIQSSKDMLTLKFQQLGIEMNNDNADRISVVEECESLKQKYAESQEQLKTLMFEKEHTVDKFRQYVENLKEELHQNTLEIQKLTNENQTLHNKISSQTEHISNLEKQLQKPNAEIEQEQQNTNLQAEIERLNGILKENEEKEKLLVEQLADYNELRERVQMLENELDNARSEMHNAHELQSIVESNKVAASQAITQNNKLKEELIRLNGCVGELSREKETLTNLLEEERTNKERSAHPQRTNFQHVNGSETEIVKNDAETNTDKGSASNGEHPYGTANLDAMLQLQEKFKCVLNKMADLTDEKQQLEHLVMQLQCETETIEEYVALYQKQRSILQQRARQTDLLMDKVMTDKEQLQAVLRAILSSDRVDSSSIRNLVESSVSDELIYELTGTKDAKGDAYLSLLNNDNHHPSCSCCSGKLITV